MNGSNREAGPQTYSIATFADFDAVPEERLDACLSEFATYVRVRRHMLALLGALGAEVVPNADPIDWKAGAFVWTDDDERCITVSLKTEPETEPPLTPDASVPETAQP